ncbi:MAG: hypothetical protein IJ078_07455, partial [Succinivibrionaceae bacterium]|nr:hypothetical protein [Succinivibrionaceae bacterium]
MTNQISNNEVRSLLLSCIPAKFTSFSHDQNLIEAGLDSLSIMKITASLRKKGIKLRFGDLMSEPNINAWCRLAQSCSADAAPSEIRKTDEPLRNIKEQKIFNLTDLQNAYWTGRSTEAQLGGVSCHAYIELDGNITNPEKLRDAFSSLCLRHQSLRMRIADGGQMIDRENANEPLNIVNLREMSVEEAEKASTEIRRKISHRCLDVASGKVIGATLLLLPEGFTGSDNIAVSTRLCIDIDLIASDVRSMNIILHDLAALYRGDDLPDVSKFSFARYLELRDEKNREEIERDRLWWAAKASSLPQGPELPVQYSAVPAGTAPVYSRRSFTVGKEKWERLTALCRSRGVTPAMLLCTAYACTLAEYSTSRKFLLNLPLFDREPLMDGTDYAVADFSNLLLLECDFSDHETSFIEQALQLQKKFHEAAGHCAVSGVSVEREIMRAQNTSGPAAPVVFACNLDSPLPDPYASGIIGRLSYMISQTPQVILDHQVYEFNGELYDAWDMADAVFPEGLADDLFNSYRHLLESLAENPQTIYEQINLPLNPETVKERARSNSTGWEIPAALYGDGTIHGRIFRHAAEHPEDPALFFADQQISYGRLRESALRVASLLML